jgi:hypothetical protein
MGNTQTIELMEDVHIGHTFWGNADASKFNDLHHTHHSTLPAGTRANIVSPGVVEVEEQYRYRVGGKYLNINETEWKLISGPPSEHALFDRTR